MKAFSRFGASGHSPRTWCLSCGCLGLGRDGCVRLDLALKGKGHHAVSLTQLEPQNNPFL